MPAPTLQCRWLSAPRRLPFPRFSPTQPPPPLQCNAGLSLLEHEEARQVVHRPRPGRSLSGPLPRRKSAGQQAIWPAAFAPVPPARQSHGGVDEQASMPNKCPSAATVASNGAVLPLPPVPPYNASIFSAVLAARDGLFTLGLTSSRHAGRQRSSTSFSKTQAITVQQPRLFVQSLGVRLLTGTCCIRKTLPRTSDHRSHPKAVRDTAPRLNGGWLSWETCRIGG